MGFQEKDAGLGNSLRPKKFKRLKEEQERELWDQRPESIPQLAEHHIPLVYRIIYQFKVGGDEDMISTAFIGLMKAVRTYDPTCGYKFSSYLNACVRTEFLNEWKSRKRSQVPGLPDHVADYREQRKVYSWNELMMLFHPDDYELLKLRYEEQLTLLDIGQRLGVSKQYVFELLKRAFRRMRRPEDYGISLD